MRVFKTCLGWSEVIFIFDENISFKEISDNVGTSMLTKEDFIIKQEFNEEFLKLFEFKYINNKKYYYKFFYHSESLKTPEETKWVNL